MKMKKRLSILAAVILMLSLTMTTFAATTTTTGTPQKWGEETSKACDWCPRSGSITPTFYKVSNGQNYAKTYLSFTLSATNVTAIKTFNNEKKYFGMDIKNVPSRALGLDMMSAYSIATSLPNPKTDIENDDLLGSRNEEAEAIALGTVSATSYYMSVMWYDYRNNGEWDNGSWAVNVEISSKGQSDYNVDDWYPCADIRYTNTPGEE